MRRLMTRRVLIWTAVPLILAQIGCAARSVQVAPSPLAARVSEAARKACDEPARKAIKPIVAHSSSGFRLTGDDIVFVIALPVLVPALVLTAPFWMTSAGNPQERRWRESTYTELTETCLRPIVLAQTLGPEHPDVATALVALANDYRLHNLRSEAERPYQRALAIQERALGPDHPDVAATLGFYAVLLRNANRGSEAAELEARAQAIRAKIEAARQTDAAPSGGTPAEVGEPVDPAVAAPPTPEHVE